MPIEAGSMRLLFPHLVSRRAFEARHRQGLRLRLHVPDAEAHPGERAERGEVDLCERVRCHRILERAAASVSNTPSSFRTAGTSSAAAAATTTTAVAAATAPAQALATATR